MSTPPKGYRVISFGQADGLPKGWYWERTTKVSQGPWPSRDEAIKAAERDRATFSEARSPVKVTP